MLPNLKGTRARNYHFLRYVRSSNGNFQKIEDLIALEPYNELNRLNQVQLVGIGRVSPVALPLPALGLALLVPLMIKVDSQLEQSMW